MWPSFTVHHRVRQLTQLLAAVYACETEEYFISVRLLWQQHWQINCMLLNTEGTHWHTLIWRVGGRPDRVHKKLSYEREKGRTVDSPSPLLWGWSWIKTNNCAMQVCVCLPGTLYFTDEQPFPFHLHPPGAVFKGTSLLCLGVNDQRQWL